MTNYQIFAEMDDAQYSKLKEDIRIRGVLVPLEYDENGTLLDGHHRLRAYLEIKDEGCDIKPPPRFVRTGLNENQKLEHIDAINRLRRHLTPKQREESWIDMRKKGMSFRQIAEKDGTVSKSEVARTLDATVPLGTVDMPDTTIGKDGKKRPSHKPKARPKQKTVYVSAEAAEKAESLPGNVLENILLGSTKISDAVREAKKTALVERLETVAAREIDAPTGLYDVIVIDPPWPMQKIERDVRPNQVAFDYPTMDEEELSALTIPADTDCHVWLWTTQKFLPMAFRLLDAWGLKYVCTFVWHKPGGFQPIGLPQYNAEFALYARKGTPSFIDTKAFPTCFTAARGAHSEKPEEFYEIVRRVTAGRRLDMFNRREISGFQGWGKEAAA